MTENRFKYPHWPNWPKVDLNLNLKCGFSSQPHPKILPVSCGWGILTCIISFSAELCRLFIPMENPNLPHSHNIFSNAIRHPSFRRSDKRDQSVTVNIQIPPITYQKCCTRIVPITVTRANNQFFTSPARGVISWRRVGRRDQAESISLIRNLRVLIFSAPPTLAGACSPVQYVREKLISGWSNERMDWGKEINRLCHYAEKKCLPSPKAGAIHASQG